MYRHDARNVMLNLSIEDTEIFIDNFIDKRIVLCIGQCIQPILTRLEHVSMSRLSTQRIEKLMHLTIIKQQKDQEQKQHQKLIYEFLFLTNVDNLTTLLFMYLDKECSLDVVATC